VLVIGRGSGIARAVALAARDAGAHVTAAGRDQEKLADTYAPIRVNAISPGVIESGAWDALGEQGKADYYAHMRDINPARRIGTTDDVANTVLFAMSSTFLTGQTLHIDGGEPLT
jgi:NAD(P)-dependent dehydrogenase (short-subunit alcohol dehydrogenase family)